MFDLKDSESADTDLSTHRTDDPAKAIKQAMSAFRKVLRSDLPAMTWGAPIRVAKSSQAGVQDLTGCGCGCS